MAHDTTTPEESTQDLRHDWGVAERLLATICKRPPATPKASAKAADTARSLRYEPGRKLADFRAQLPALPADYFVGKRVLDIGSSNGALLLDLADQASALIGLEIVDEYIEEARELAEKLGVTNLRVCNPLSDGLDDIRADVVLSRDSFEHYDRPDEILAMAARVLPPGGEMLISFGPPWRHPLGHHAGFMCGVPWFHMFFGERAIMNVRRLWRSDGARTFSEVSGGLNRITLARFERCVRESPFEITWRHVNAIKGIRPLAALPWVREFFTASMACVLRRAQ